MGFQWQATCKDCGVTFGYSDDSKLLSEQRGQSPPERCPACRARHNRLTAVMGSSYFQPRLRAGCNATNLTPGLLGKLDHPPRKHEQIQIPSGFKPELYGVSTDNVKDVFEWFSEKSHQVVVVEGPTGSGKSTALPYYLLNPPDAVRSQFRSDLFTRDGQIVVTQPRIQAARRLSIHVGEDLYGTSIGAGFDVGFRYKNNPCSDWRCKLVYMTDGTLINWIVTSQLDAVSTIIIDEAHERSLNIDLILMLLKQRLVQYPHLKLIIASATIDTEMFRDYYNRGLPADSPTAAIVSFNEKRKHSITSYSADKLADKDMCPMPFWKDLKNDYMNNTDKIPEYAARTAVQLLTNIENGKMYFEEETGEDNSSRGDMLIFMHGEKAILDTVAFINDYVLNNPLLANRVIALPLYAKLPQEEQDKALKNKKDITSIDFTDKIRVVVTTNVAETSLTVNGVRYVLDTGLKFEEEWKSADSKKAVTCMMQSKAGCKQRHGRAGRETNGAAFWMYTQEQFDSFEDFSLPQVERTSLESLILSAKAAGVDDLNDLQFLEEMHCEDDLSGAALNIRQELARAEGHLYKIGALSDCGDITDHGLAMQRASDDLEHVNLMINADRFGCAPEMSVLLPIIKLGEVRKLLKKNPSWDIKTMEQVEAVHNLLLSNCSDDIEASLRIYKLWSELEIDGVSIVPESVFKPQWDDFIINSVLPEVIVEKLGSKNTEFINELRSLNVVCDFNVIETLAEQYNVEAEAKPWLRDLRFIHYDMQQKAWADYNFVSHNMLSQRIRKGSDELLQNLTGHTKEDERRPLSYKMLNKLRLLFAYCITNNRYIRNENESQKNAYIQLVSDKTPFLGTVEGSGCHAGAHLSAYTAASVRYKTDDQNNSTAKANFVARLELDDMLWINEKERTIFELAAHIHNMNDCSVNCDYLYSYFVRPGVSFSGVTQDESKKRVCLTSINNFLEAPLILESMVYGENKQSIENVSAELLASDDGTEIVEESIEESSWKDLGDYSNDIGVVFSALPKKSKNTAISILDYIRNNPDFISNCRFLIKKADLVKTGLVSDLNDKLPVSDTESLVMTRPPRFDYNNVIVENALLELIQKNPQDSEKKDCILKPDVHRAAFERLKNEVDASPDSLRTLIIDKVYYDSKKGLNSMYDAHDLNTGATAVLKQKDITFSHLDRLAVKSGTQIEAFVTSFDEKSGTFNASCLQMSERVQNEFLKRCMQKDEDLPIRVPVRVSSVEKYHVILNLPWHAGSVFSQHRIKSSDKLSLNPSDEFDARISLRSKTTMRYGDFSEEFHRTIDSDSKPVIFSNFSHEKGNLVFNGHLTTALKCALHSRDSSVTWQEAIEKLYHDSNMITGLVPDESEGATCAAKVLGHSDSSVLLQLYSGNTVRYHIKGFRPCDRAYFNLDRSMLLKDKLIIRYPVGLNVRVRLYKVALGEEKVVLSCEMLSAENDSEFVLPDVQINKQDEQITESADGIVTQSISRETYRKTIIFLEEESGQYNACITGYADYGIFVTLPSGRGALYHDSNFTDEDKQYFKSTASMKPIEAFAQRYPKGAFVNCHILRIQQINEKTRINCVLSINE